MGITTKMRFKVVGFVKYSLDQDISERKLGHLKSAEIEIATTQLTSDALDDRLAQKLAGWKLETVWFPEKEDLPTSGSIYSESQFYALGHSMSAQEADPLNLFESSSLDQEGGTAMGTLKRSSLVVEQELRFWEKVIAESYETGLEQQEQSLFVWEPLQSFPELHSSGMYLDRLKLTEKKYISLESLYGDGFSTRLVGTKFSKYPYSEFENEDQQQQPPTVISIPPGILLAVPLLSSDRYKSRSEFISSKMGGKALRVRATRVPLIETSFRCVQVDLTSVAIPAATKKSYAEFVENLRGNANDLSRGNPGTTLKVYLLKGGSVEAMSDLDSRLTELLDRKRACDQQQNAFIRHTLAAGSTCFDAFECTICGSSSVIKKIALMEHSPNGVIMVCSPECEQVLGELLDVLKNPKSGKRKLAAATTNVKVKAYGITPQNFEILRLLKIKQTLGKASQEELKHMNLIRSERPHYSNESSQSKQMFYTATSPTFTRPAPVDMNNGVFLVNENPLQVVSFTSHQPQHLSHQQLRNFCATTNQQSVANVWKL